MKKIYFYLPLILFFIIGCEKEEIVELQEESIKISTVTHEEALGLINKISPGKGKNNGKLTILYDQIYFESIINSKEKLTVIPVIFPIEGINSKILMLKINGKINYVLFSMIPDSPLEDQKDFDGRIIINDLNGKFINGFRIKNGYIISQLIMNAALNKCDSDEGFEGITGDGCFQDLDEVIITSSKEDSQEDLYTLQIDYMYPYSGGGADFDSYYYDFQGDPGGGGGGSSGGDTTTTPIPDEEAFEDKIDASELEGKAKCLFEKLKNNNLFENTIGVFDNNDFYTLTIKEGYCGTGVDGCTNGGDIENGNVLIKIQSFGNYTLDLAATILHEGIHAEIYKYVYEYNSGIDPIERRNLLNYYFHFGAKNGLDMATTKAQHQFMADNYVKPIAQAMRELDGFRFPLENYMGFGWDGLRAYGYNGYYDNGVFKTLDKGIDTEYYKNQAEILATTIFNKDCTEN